MVLYEDVFENFEISDYGSLYLENVSKNCCKKSVKILKI